MRVCVFGLGYVGSVTAALLADQGHHVVGIDLVQEKVEAINNGGAPVREPGLSELIRSGVRAGRLQATSDASQELLECELAMICVGTPADPAGGADLSQVLRVVEEIVNRARGRTQPLAVVNRSTMPPMAHRTVMRLLVSVVRDEHYIVHPEFLREGCALADARDAQHVVFGSTSPSQAREVASSLYPGHPGVRVLSIESAAIFKYANNCFHATKVAFANEIGRLSRLEGADGRVVMSLLASDTRLNSSSAYLSPGAPFGGSCLAKDVSAVQSMWRQHEDRAPLISSVLESNARHLEVIEDWCNAIRGTVGIYGLAFKHGTDDLRNSPSVSLAKSLAAAGRRIVAFDPMFDRGAFLGENLRAADDLSRYPGIDLVRTSAHLCQQASHVVLMMSPRDGDPALIRFAEVQPVLDASGVEWLRSCKQHQDLFDRPSGTRGRSTEHE